MPHLARTLCVVQAYHGITILVYSKDKGLRGAIKGVRKFQPKLFSPTLVKRHCFRKDVGPSDIADVRLTLSNVFHGYVSPFVHDLFKSMYTSGTAPTLTYHALPFLNPEEGTG